MMSIVWTIAGSDTSGGAGIQADLLTFQAFGVHGCSIVTALTAQNSLGISHIAYTPAKSVRAQLSALLTDLPASVIKLGMLGNRKAIEIVADFLAHYSGIVICDPVINASKGGILLKKNDIQFFCRQILPHVDILTPNIPEMEALTNKKIASLEDMKCLAQQLISESGIKTVLVKGGHMSDLVYSQDYYCDSNQSFWLTSPRHNTSAGYGDLHGSGCVFSAALAAALAKGCDQTDSVVLAKMYINQGIRLAKPVGGYHPIGHGNFPSCSDDLPWVTKQANLDNLGTPFLSPKDKIGLYPIVNNAQSVESLAKLGVKQIQLRIKDQDPQILIMEIKKSINLASKFKLKLYINDYWEIALSLGAYGVHLGQEDLEQADVVALQRAGICLGISVHNYYELATAHAFKPSYIAFGPIYPTKSKVLTYAPRGIIALQQIRKIVSYPLIAIGGINLENCEEVMRTGVEGIAMMSSISNANDLSLTVNSFQKKLKTTICKKK